MKKDYRNARNLFLVVLVITALVHGAESYAQTANSPFLKRKAKSTPTVVPTPVVQEEVEEEDPFEGYAQTGVIASSISGVGSKDVDTLGVLDLAGEKKPPFFGSIGMKNSEKIHASVSNSSDKRVTAQLRVRQYTERNSLLKSDPLSVSLAPGEKITREYSAMPGVSNLKLEVVSWSAQ